MMTPRDHSDLVLGVRSRAGLRARRPRRPGNRAVIGSGGGTLFVCHLDVGHWKDKACDIAAAT
jgi:hypothetical protein